VRSYLGCGKKCGCVLYLCETIYSKYEIRDFLNDNVLAIAHNLSAIILMHLSISGHIHPQGTFFAKDPMSVAGFVFLSNPFTPAIFCIKGIGLVCLY